MHCLWVSSLIAIHDVYIFYFLGGGSNVIQVSVSLLVINSRFFIETMDKESSIIDLTLTTVLPSVLLFDI